MKAAVLFNGSRCKINMEVIFNQRCVLLHLKIGDQMEVAIPKNSNERHHRMKPDVLSKNFKIRRCQPELAEVAGPTNTVDNRVAIFDFKLVETTLLMFNTIETKL